MVVVRIFLALAVILGSSLCGPVQNVRAEDKPTVPSKGLTLSPLRSELETAPGTSLDGSLTVTNSTDKPMSISVNAEEFRVVNQQYDYAFTEESNVTKWVSFVPSKVELEPGKSKDITYTIGVPLATEPGGRYISLFASTDTQSDDGGVKSRQRIASLVYLTVTGKVTRVGHMLSLTSPWMIGGPSAWSVTLQNTGTTHFRSAYSLRIQNLIGDGDVASMQGDALILPGTVRAVSDILPVPKFPGVYKEVYHIGLGDSRPVEEMRYILYLPTWAGIAVFMIVIFLVMWIFRKRPSRKT